MYRIMQGRLVRTASSCKAPPLTMSDEYYLNHH